MTAMGFPKYPGPKTHTSILLREAAPPADDDIIKCAADVGDYICTRPDGHTGAHVTHAADDNEERFPNEVVAIRPRDEDLEDDHDLLTVDPKHEGRQFDLVRFHDGHTIPAVADDDGVLRNSDGEAYSSGAYGIKGPTDQGPITDNETGIHGYDYTKDRTGDVNEDRLDNKLDDILDEDGGSE